MEKAARRPAKRARLNLRASERQLELLRLAAEVQGKTLSDFVLGTATERAQELLVEQRHFVASPEAWEEFMRLLESPPPPSPVLVELFQDVNL